MRSERWGVLERMACSENLRKRGLRNSTTAVLGLAEMGVPKILLY
jgi:hypothetical protein